MFKNKWDFYFFRKIVWFLFFDPLQLIHTKNGSDSFESVLCLSWVRYSDFFTLSIPKDLSANIFKIKNCAKKRNEKCAVKVSIAFNYNRLKRPYLKSDTKLKSKYGVLCYVIGTAIPAYLYWIHHTEYGWRPPQNPYSCVWK